MSHYHAVVWIDHHEARIFHFDAEHVDRQIVHPKNPGVHLHHKANSIGSGHAPESAAFYHDVVRALGDAGAVLVTGPANAKDELAKHVEHHDRQMKERIIAVQPLDHPSDGEIVAHARKFFRAADRMAAQ